MERNQKRQPLRLTKMKRTIIILGLFLTVLPRSLYAQSVLPISLAQSTPSIERSARIPILIYHSVRPYYPGITNLVKEFTVPPDIFDNQMKYLATNGFTVITFDELSDYFQNAKPLPPKPVMVTLDDGWENQYIYAFPILKKYKYRGIFYIYPGAVGKKHFLLWPEVKEMLAGNMVIADHTLSHPQLPKITSLEILKKEILGSKQIIEKQLNSSVKDFAYPFGAFNDQNIRIVKEAGYRSGRTVHAGVKADSSAPYTIDGIIITGDFNRFVSFVNK